MDKPKLSDRVKAHNTKAKSRAAALLGSEGGKAKVPKGFSMKSPEERAEAGKAGMLKRWGKLVSFNYITFAVLPRDAQKIMEAAVSHQVSIGSKYRPHDIGAAISDLISIALEPHGVKVVLVTSGEETDLEIGPMTADFFAKEDKSLDR